MLLNLLLSLANKIEHLQTLTGQKGNWLKTVDGGVQIETDASRQKFNSGQKEKPYDFISNDFIFQGWNEFIEKRKATASDFIRTRGRSSFLMAFFSQLPFVKVSTGNGPIAIELIEYKTDELPSEPYQNTLEFLDEVINGKYPPQKLSSVIEDKSLLRIKNGCRQDLRLLGLLNEDNSINHAVMQQILNEKDKISVYRKLIKEKEYFKMALNLLEIVSELPKNEKRGILEEIGMLIVRNSQAENLMVDNVAKKRTTNLLRWLEFVDLIDNEWVPKEPLFFYKKEKRMESKIREFFIKIMDEYLSAKQERFAGHSLGSFVRHEVPNEIATQPFLKRGLYSVCGSVGQGNWASIPWIAIMNKTITESTQRGYYVVYLFSEDMKCVYLTFAQGVTETSKEEMAIIKSEIRNNIKMGEKFRKDDEIFLGNSTKAKQYVNSTAAYIRYDRENMPSEDVLISDLKNMIGYYEDYIKFKEDKSPDDSIIIKEEHKSLSTSEDLVKHIYSYIKSKGFLYSRKEIINLYLSLKTKPFVILSGISGTGKTKMVQWFAESLAATEDNGQFNLIPIRPDWNDSSDLLGYRDIKGEFKPGPLTKIILRAKKNDYLPYFVLLDEMNLARVEYYFSDILSVMESRKWQDGKMISTVLLSKEVTGYEEDIRIPSNLYIIGTVNMDETTHPFSKKVLDRANTIEFNRVELSNLSFLNDSDEVAPIPVFNDKLASKYLYLKDVYQTNQELVIKVTEELEQINKSLQIMNAHVGYRVRDEICFYLAYNQEEQLMKDKEAFDHCILQKILPRITGSDSRVKQVLMELYQIFSNKEFVDGLDSYESDLVMAKYPQSARKVIEMLRRLHDDGFTSFWIS